MRTPHIDGLENNKNVRQKNNDNKKSINGSNRNLFDTASIENKYNYQRFLNHPNDIKPSYQHEKFFKYKQKINKKRNYRNNSNVKRYNKGFIDEKTAMNTSSNTSRAPEKISYSEDRTELDERYDGQAVKSTKAKYSIHHKNLKYLKMYPFLFENKNANSLGEVKKYEKYATTHDRPTKYSQQTNPPKKGLPDEAGRSNANKKYRFHDRPRLPSQWQGLSHPLLVQKGFKKSEGQSNDGNGSLARKSFVEKTQWNRAGSKLQLQGGLLRPNSWKRYQMHRDFDKAYKYKNNFNVKLEEIEGKKRKNRLPKENDSRGGKDYSYNSKFSEPNGGGNKKTFIEDQSKSSLLFKQAENDKNVLHRSWRIKNYGKNRTQSGVSNANNYSKKYRIKKGLRKKDYKMRNNADDKNRKYRYMKVNRKRRFNRMNKLKNEKTKNLKKKDGKSSFANPFKHQIPILNYKPNNRPFVDPRGGRRSYPHTRESFENNLQSKHDKKVKDRRLHENNKIIPNNHYQSNQNRFRKKESNKINGHFDDFDGKKKYIRFEGNTGTSKHKEKSNKRTKASQYGDERNHKSYDVNKSKNVENKSTRKSAKKINKKLNEKISLQSNKKLFNANNKNANAKLDDDDEDSENYVLGQNYIVKKFGNKKKSHSKKKPNKIKKKIEGNDRKPNVILILTDDQDSHLGMVLSNFFSN